MVQAVESTRLSTCICSTKIRTFTLPDELSMSNTNIYIFSYTNTTDDEDNTTQQVALIGSYAFAIDNGNCTPEGNGSGTCNQKSDSCSSGIGYYDNTSETHKCCSCTPEFAGEDMIFTSEDGKVEGLTPVEQ